MRTALGHDRRDLIIFSVMGAMWALAYGHMALGWKLLVLAALFSLPTIILLALRRPEE